MFKTQTNLNRGEDQEVTMLRKSRQYGDLTLGDQKTTLAAVKSVQADLKKFGLYATIEYNPTFPQGMDYLVIDSTTEKPYIRGEHIFLLCMGVQRLNADSVIQLLEDERPADEKISRLMLDFKLGGNIFDLPVVRSLVTSAIQAKFDE